MPDRRANTTNAYESTLTNTVSGTDLTFNVQSTSGAPGTPCYLCINPETPSKREYVWFNGGFTGTSFTTTTLSNRHLQPGSAATSGLEHDPGTPVRAVTAAQLFIDLHDRIEALLALVPTLPVDVTSGGTGAANAATARDNLGITALIDLKAALAGATFTGEVIVPDVRVSVETVTDSGAVVLDFTKGFLLHTLSGNVSYTASNFATGRSLTVRVKSDATLRTLAFPAGWVFVSPKPTNISASKTGILTLTSFGTTDADVVAAWAVQE